MIRIPGLDPRFTAQFAPRVAAPRSAPGVALSDEDLDAIAGDVFAAATRESTGRAPDAVTVQRIGPPDVTPAARGYADIPGARISAPGAPTMVFDDVPEAAPDVPGDTMAFDDEGALITAPGVAFDVPDAYAFDGTQEPPAVAAVPPPPIAPAAMATGGPIPAPTTPAAAPAVTVAGSAPVPPPMAAQAPAGAAVPGLAGLWDPAQAPPGAVPGLVAGSAVAGAAPRAVDPTPGPGQAKAASSYRGPQYMTADEKADLARAEIRDRRMRIAQGVVGGLGGLVGLIGAARGTGAAEFGTGLMSAAGAIPAGRMTEAVNQRIGERRAFEAANLVRADEAARAAATQAREGEELALRRRAVEAQAARDEAAAAEDAARAQIARDMAEAERASLPSLRATFRAAIESIDMANPQAAPYRQLVESGALDSMSRTDLLEGLQRLMGDRFEFRGVAGTGGLSRGREVTEYIPGVGYRTHTVGGGRPAGAAPAGGGAAPAPMPSAASRRPAPSTPAALAPEVLAGGPIPEEVRTDPGTLMNIYREELRSSGIDPDSERGRGFMTRYMAMLDAGDAGMRNALDELGRVQREAVASEASGRPTGVSAADWAYVRTPAFVEGAELWQRTSALLQNMERAYRESPGDFILALRAAGQGGTIALPADASELARQMTGYLTPTLSRLAGANVTEQELQRITQSMGLSNLGQAVRDPEQFLRRVRESFTEIQTLMRARSASVRRAAAHVFAESIGGDAAGWERRLGGGR